MQAKCEPLLRFAETDAALAEIGNLRGASTITAGSTMLLSVAVKLSTGVLLYRCSGSAILVGST